jgi:hypothetical protein
LLELMMQKYCRLHVDIVGEDRIIHLLGSYPKYVILVFPSYMIQTVDSMVVRIMNHNGCDE